MSLTLKELAEKVTALEQEIKQYQQDILELEVQVLSDKKSHPPIGSIIFYASENVPNDKYKLCDGLALSRNDYKDLFLVIGTIWGAGDGSTTFNIPDIRGVFPRFLDLGSGRNLGRQLGILETSATHLPNNPFSISTDGSHTHAITSDGDHTHGVQQDGVHTHPLTAAGDHTHKNGAYEHLLQQSGHSTEAGNLDDGPQPDLNSSKPMTRSGNHSHSVSSAGTHAHSLNSAGSHSHAIQAEGNHSHSVSGGDDETRPINHALVGFIRVA